MTGCQLIEPIDSPIDPVLPSPFIKSIIFRRTIFFICIFPFPIGPGRITTLHHDNRPSSRSVCISLIGEVLEWSLEKQVKLLDNWDPLFRNTGSGSGWYPDYFPRSPQKQNPQKHPGRTTRDQWSIVHFSVRYFSLHSTARHFARLPSPL